ncbi:MAG TPA: ABC transporter permease subunit [Dehalococcoidia bacterium]|nr:ABC transporter permease subunit [Dehalococcoidia bacterium]
MAEQAGAIYDLGYRHYDGERRGYGAVLWTLYVDSLRIAFGFGRKFVYKIVPLTLLAIAVVPALIALGIASVVGDDLTPYRYDNYYGVVAVAIALYCATIAPDLVGRDLRNRTLPLYISRGITRLDYIAVKIAALVSATLLFSLVPQALLFAGNTLAARNAATYVSENLEAIPQIVLSALAIGVLLGSLAVAFSAYTTNRAYATGGFVALIILSTAVANIVFEAVEGSAAGGSLDAGGDTSAWGYVLLLGIFDVMEGVTEFIFNTQPDPDESRADADFWEGWYVISLLAMTGVAIFLTVRRYRRLPL